MTSDESRLDEVMTLLRDHANPDHAAGMRRFGIAGAQVLGVSVTTLRKLARPYRRDHALALALWDTGVHEARILASVVDDPNLVTEAQMERWVADLDSWDVCDGCCGNLFDRTPFAFAKAAEWSARHREFEKRAGFALMAWLAVHDKRATDDAFLPLLTIIEREAGDDRNFVRKAVNWALRQIGKRNRLLNMAAITTAERIAAQETKAAQWVASDALRELRSEAVQRRLS